jgi:hypothetical protein
VCLVRASYVCACVCVCGCRLCLRVCVVTLVLRGQSFCLPRACVVTAARPVAARRPLCCRAPVSLPVPLRLTLGVVSVPNVHSQRSLGGFAPPTRRTARAGVPVWVMMTSHDDSSAAPCRRPVAGGLHAPCRAGCHTLLRSGPAQHRRSSAWRLQLSNKLPRTHTHARTNAPTRTRNTHAHTRTHNAHETRARNTHTHTHTHTHPRAHAPAPARAHHTHITPSPWY